MPKTCVYFTIAKQFAGQNHDQTSPSPSHKVWGTQETSEHQPDQNRHWWAGCSSKTVSIESFRVHRTNSSRGLGCLPRSGQAGGTVGQLIALYSEELETKLAEVNRLQQKLQELEAIQESLNVEDKSA